MSRHQHSRLSSQSKKEVLLAAMEEKTKKSVTRGSQTPHSSGSSEYYNLYWCILPRPS
jgi:hypothetical protein